MMPRLYRYFGRAFTSTHSLMLSFTSTRKGLSACSPSHPWDPLFFIMVLTLSTACSFSDPPFSCQDAALIHLGSLPSHDLVIWIDYSVLFGRGGFAIIANCSFCGNEATLSSSVGSTCSSLSAKAHATLLALRWCGQH